MDDAARTPQTDVARELLRLEKHVLSLAREMRASIAKVAPERRQSAANLVHYVALRQQDLRELQVELSQRGLSSLGRSESCVVGSLLEVSARAQESRVLHGDRDAAAQLARLERSRRTTLSWEAARALLHRHTRELLGPRPEDRHIYVMVTAPPAAEATRAWMEKMLRAGMNVLRVNCAHEGDEQWGATLDALEDARRATGKGCRVLMDLAGPKIRTGPIESAARIVTWKPVRDAIGRAVEPARVVVRGASAAPDAAVGAYLELPDDELRELRVGDEIRFRDARRKKRRLQVTRVDEGSVEASASDRAYVRNRADALLYRDGLPERDLALVVEDGGGSFIDVRSGDPLVLSRRRAKGRPPRRSADGSVTKAGVVGCTLPEALDHMEVGHRVLFDDGRIHAVVERMKKRSGDALLRVTRTQREPQKLYAEKGINLPDTVVATSSLTDEDLRALPFVARRADAVGLSFVRTPADVTRLHDELDRLGRSGIGVVLKIETRRAFENLPRLLLEGMRRPPLGVMIARGDLAVEVGFERLAEVQEEILWLCEASHVPAIWATQVLDTLARTGVPSRAEVTDAAASVAAECVMLNKGPYIREAVTALTDILRRMEKHRDKKRSLFRKLQVSTFSESPVGLR